MERGHEIKVLDHGYVRYVDHLGSDETIVEAARVSTGRGFVSWFSYKRCTHCSVVARDRSAYPTDCTPGTDGSKLRSDHVWQDFPRGDLGILDYLYRMEHTSPFEMCELVVDVMVPMDHWRQWIRNRTASVNEYSTRYSEAIDVMAATAPDAWRTQGVTNRQGSGEFLPAGPAFMLPVASDSPGTIATGAFAREAPGHWLSEREAALHRIAREVYEERLVLGVAKEQARKDLPLSNYTAARWKIDLHNLLHAFLAKRLHSHAQLEIRQYAQAVAEIVKALWPRTYALFEEWTLGAVRLSRTEAAEMRALVEAGKTYGRMSDDPVKFPVSAVLAAKLGCKS